MGSIFILQDRIKKDREPLHLDIPLKKVLENLETYFVSDRFWILPILFLALAVRLYRFEGPVADWHSWRQADTSSVTRDFVKKGINWLYPTYDDISSVPSGRFNPQGLRFVEFPLYNAISATTKRVVPELTIEESGRMTSVFSSVLSVLFIFLISRQRFKRRACYLIATVYAVLPYSIFYGRSILPDPTMVALSLGAILFALQNRLILVLFFSALALLVKPYALFLLMPIGYVFLRKGKIAHILIFSLSITPLVLWRWWISRFPEGIPASDWLFNGNGIRFKGAFWYWLFADRIGRLILGYWGLVPLSFGWIKADKFLKIFILSSLSYLAIFATGNVQHDYYQILLIPGLSILVGLGLDYLLRLNKLLAMTTFVFMIGFGWYHIRDYYNINHPEIVIAGKALQDLAREHEKALVIAPYDGDTAFLYQTNHKGWPIMDGSLDDLIKKGADYYVSVKFDEQTKAILADSETKESWLARSVKNPQAKRKKFILLANLNSFVIVQLVPDKILPGN